MKRYVEIYTMWTEEEESKGSVLIDCSELKPEEHSETLKLLEDNKFIITAVNAVEINGYLELSHEKVFNIAKRLIDKGFEWKPENQKKDTK